MAHNILFLAALPVAFALLGASSAYATHSEEATLALQSEFPICSEVLKAQQEASDMAQSTDEQPQGTELAKTLNKLKRQGADINAYFRMGTPLHHAACADWEAGVDWLLRQGADPLLPIQSGSEDALGIAIRTGNWGIATLLLKHYQRLLKTPGISDKQKTQIHASVGEARQGNTSNAAQRFEALLHEVHWQLTPEQYGQQFGKLLCNGQPNAALALHKTQPWGNRTPPAVSDPAWVCPASSQTEIPESAWPHKTDIASWRALDTLLPAPVLLRLIPLLPKGKETQSLQAAIAEGLRMPWQNKENAIAYFKAVLSRRNALHSTEPALLRLMREDDLLSALNTPDARIEGSSPHCHSHFGGSIALLHASTWPLPDLEWLLKHTSPTLMEELRNEDCFSREASAEYWTRLTPHLTKPFSLIYGYPRKLPYALWPQWKALGAVPDERFWSWWLAAVPLADLPEALPIARKVKEVDPPTWSTEADWAKLLLRAKPEELPGFVAFVQAERPELGARLMDWALAPLSYGPTPDAVALEIDRSSWNRAAADPWAQVRQLDALGFRAAHPRYLVDRLLSQDISDAIPTLAEAIQKGWGIAPPNLGQAATATEISSAPQPEPALHDAYNSTNSDSPNRDSKSLSNSPWVKPQLTCQKRVDEGLRRALAENQGRARDFDSPVWEYLLPVQVEGLSDCQWLVVGGDFAGKRSWTDHDFFEGDTMRQTGAADGNRFACFWHVGKKTCVESGAEPEYGEFFDLQQSGQSETYLVASGGSSMGAGIRAGNMYQPRLSSDSTVVLEPLPEDHLARIRLIAQCESDLVLDDCNALQEPQKEGEPIGSNTLAGEIFADTYLPEAKQAFLSALFANDRTALNDMRDAGLFPHWLSEGLQTVSKAGGLSQREKRRRAAWVLAQSQPAADYDDATLAALMSWLPPEDWRPIVKRLECYRRGSLLEDAAVKDNPALLARLKGEMNRVNCRDEP